MAAVKARAHDRAYNRTRSAEWLLACILFAWGANVIRPNSSFDYPSYRIMVALMQESTWGMLAVLVSVARMAALFVNGTWKRTPLIRLFCAIASGLFWVSIFFLMFVGARGTEAILPNGFYSYLFYFGFEGLCTFSAAFDMQRKGALSLRSA